MKAPWVVPVPHCCGGCACLTRPVEAVLSRYGDPELTSTLLGYEPPGGLSSLTSDRFCVSGAFPKPQDPPVLSPKAMPMQFASPRNQEGSNAPSPRNGRLP